LERLPDGLTACHIPQDDGGIFTSGGQDFAVWTEGNTRYKSAVSLEWLRDGLTACHIPQDNGVILTSRSQGFAIRAEGNTSYSLAVASQILG
jgi:hypothetical protein